MKRIQQTEIRMILQMVIDSDGSDGSINLHRLVLLN